MTRQLKTLFQNFQSVKSLSQFINCSPVLPLTDDLGILLQQALCFLSIIHIFTTSIIAATAFTILLLKQYLCLILLYLS